jgi:hypothetical protein
MRTLVATAPSEYAREADCDTRVDAGVPTTLDIPSERWIAHFVLCLRIVPRPVPRESCTKVAV